MLRFTESDVRRLLPMRETIERLRVVFTDYASGRAQNQPRRRLVLPGGATLHQLAAAWGGYFGAKVYSTHVKHGAYFTVLLYDAETAKPLAEFEANHLGQIRTGAVSGLAADLLLPQGQRVDAACIGTGFQAHSQVAALAAVRTLSSLKVYSRSAEKRQNFAVEMRELLGAATEIREAESAEAAAEGAKVLITATWAKDPVIEASAVAKGTLVLAMGSNQPQRRELPAELVRNNIVVVEDTEACRVEAGDLLLAFDEADWSRVVELRSLVAGAPPPATENTVVFKSVGMGLEDVGAAALIYERAVKDHS
ncbi:MAG: ornithine cyclodeaminase family protein [Bryobacteraceae bacterium]|nr:ornithine cyclodeaminase family protein [Bryobacteraceae bacterium]